MPIKKTARKSHRHWVMSFLQPVLNDVLCVDFGETVGRLGLVGACLSEPAGRGLLLKTASLFINKR
jgi:hypothetical protein